MTPFSDTDDDEAQLRFARVTLSDQKTFLSFMDQYQPMSCEYSFANLFIWQDMSNVFWTIYRERLLVYDSDDYKCAFMPLGPDFSPEELADLSEKLKLQGLVPDFCLADERYLNQFPKIERYYQLKKEPDAAEYIYDVQKLATLSGRKLHKKRNLIAQFKRMYPGFIVKRLTREYIPKVLAFSAGLIKEMGTPPEKLVHEYEALKRACKHFEQLDLDGLMIRYRDHIAAFSIFSRLNTTTFDIHFEKVNKRFKGAAQLINQETAKYLKEDCLYLNREQDLGIQGLRQAKMSYDPLTILLPCRLKFRSG